MPVVNWINHHRLLVSGVSFAVLVVVAVAGCVWFFLLRTTGTQIDLRQALRLYRQDEHGSNLRTEEGLATPGVYVYQTSGSEKLSLAGISRTFPSASDMIVTDGKCSSMDWVPFEQHVEGIQLCREPDGALTMSQASSVESIAGVSTTQVTPLPVHGLFHPAPPACRSTLVRRLPWTRPGRQDLWRGHRDNHSHRSTGGPCPLCTPASTRRCRATTPGPTPPITGSPPRPVSSTANAKR